MRIYAQSRLKVIPEKIFSATINFVRTGHSISSTYTHIIIIYNIIYYYTIIADTRSDEPHYLKFEDIIFKYNYGV